MRTRLAMGLAALAFACCAGCETFGATCDRSPEDNPPIRYTEGTTVDGVYMSSPWDGELLLFKGGMRYTLVHGLGATPRWWIAYLSFDRFGTQDGGGIAQAAGDQATVLSVDDQSIEISNPSCADYWLLVSAGVGTAPPGGP